MSVFRKYNENTKRWEPVASADATTILSGNPSITSSGETESVEDILIRDRQDIELLKKNVSWLAKHGGGGGFGPGSTTKAEVQILSPLDNTTPTNNIIWKDSIASIACKIVSSYNGTYNVVVRINGKNVYTVSNVKRNSVINIPSSVLNIGKNSVTMQVLAYDESEMEYTGECKISIASVELQKPNAVTVTQNQLLNSTPSVILTYRTSIPGNYRMYYSDTMISYDANLGWRDSVGALDDSTKNRSQYIDMINVGTTVSNLGIQLTDIYGDGNHELISKQAAPGVYARYFVMVSASDPTICSAVQSAQINVTVTNGLLVSPQFGIDENSPYTISLDSVLDLRFITYSNNTGTYSYSIWMNDKQISPQIYNNIYGTMITEKISVSNIIDEEGIYKLTIKATGLGSNAEADVYIRVTRALAELLYAYRQDINSYNIFDFTVWDNISDIDTSISCINKNFYYSGTGKYGELAQNINFYNKGADSGSTKVYYKMRHTCVGKIDSNGKQWFPKNGNDTNSIIPGANYQFTLSLAYHIDQEVDDNATVFYLGNYDPITLGGTGKGSGILITAHGYYIRIEGTSIEGVLSDNDFTQLDIVMGYGTGAMQGYTMLYIYQNGILLQATQVQINSVAGQDYSLYSFKEALLGCRSMIDKGNYYEVTRSINMDLYSVKLFSKPLNDGQIICNNINNYANYKRLTDDNALDPTLIERLLRNNSILADKDVPAQLNELGQEMYDENNQKIYNTSKISSLYDLQEGTYNWGVSVSGNDIVLGSNLQGIPVPIVAISGLNWKYSDFTSTSSKLLATPGKVRYLDGNKAPIECAVSVETQGTTTLIYDIKNIDITFQNCLFSPKESWFPEQTFTLKADVVDSGHLNNAVIGTFVNDCLNETSLINKDAFPIQSIIESNKKSNGKMMPNNMNLKATIEGFPVLLVLDFVSESGEARDPRVMGIYSFNLGRKSYYNQGFEVLNCLRDVTGNILNPDSISFPSLFGTPQASDKDSTYQAYCFEGTRSFNNSITKDDEIDINSKDPYDYAAVLVNSVTGRRIWLPSVVESGGYVKYNDKTIYDDNGNVVEWNTTNVKKFSIVPDGYFWSNHRSYASSLLWDLIYANNTNEAWDAFAVLNRCIAEKLQYTKGSASRAYNTTLDRYEVVSAEGEALERKKLLGEKFNIYFPQAKEPIEVSVKNSAFYYVVCMLFGLVDNFGKNMQMKHWTNGSNQPRWSPTFYDMDTALGIDNTGGQTILPTVFDESIINTPENKIAFMYSTAPQSTNSVFTVYSNKLWGGIDNGTFQKQYSPDYGSEEEYQVFSKMWSDLRTSKLTNIEDFIDKYLHTQLHDCGEFMYNYDYNVKYLSTSQIHMLHGNRLSFIKNWLTERIAFLDSVFGYKYTNTNESKYLTESASSSAPYITPYNISWKNQVDIIHNSASLNLPIITNKSVVMRTNIGNKSISYVYVPKNTRTYIPVADSLNTANIQTWVNNSDCIIDIDLQGIDVTNLTPQQGIVVTNKDNHVYYEGKQQLGNIYYQMGSFSSLKNLNLRNCNLTSALDFFKLFKTWDSSPYGIEPEAFSLQTLDLSGVKTPNLTANLTGEVSSDEMIPKIYKEPFTNITSINVSDSNISSISIPTGVSLYNLDIRNSNIQTLSLKDQPMLSTPSFAGCRNLEVIYIINCSRFTTLDFDNSIQSLKRLEIAGCQNLETLTIDAKDYEHIPDITIDNCPNLKTIEIMNMNNDKDTESKREITLTGVDNLETLSITNSLINRINWDGIYYSDGVRSGLTKLKKLDLSNCAINSIFNLKVNPFYPTTRPVVNLLGFESDTLQEISFKQSNTNDTIENSMTEVWFDNIKDKPFVIRTSGAFSHCKELTRVYGNIHIANGYIFQNSSKFSIHGADGFASFMGNLVFYDGKWLHPSDLNILDEDGVMWNDGSHDDGDGATNMKIINNSTYTFSGTSCTTFDAYYILQNLTNNVTNIGNLFSRSKVRFYWTEANDNSPHRDTFSRCTNITNMPYIFSGSIGNSGCRFYSPYVDADGTIRNGLFTPIKKNIAYIDNIFGEMTNVIVDRNVLRTFDEDNKFESLISIEKFSPTLVVNDVNNITYKEVESILADPLSGDNQQKHGNLSGFFKDCPNLGNKSIGFDRGCLISVLDSLVYIDYTKFDIDGLGIPNHIHTLVSSIISQYGTGNLILNLLFDNPENIKNLYASIRVLNVYKSDPNDSSSEPKYVKMYMSNNTFNGFPNMENIGYHYSSDFYTTVSETSFSGDGIVKEVHPDSLVFPYDIFNNMPNLKSIIGFFKGCDFTRVTSNESISLPGALFLKNQKLEDISYCFYNIKTGYPYKLSDNMPFQNCPKLSNVSYLFGHDVGKSDGKSCLRGSYIPSKLFYHGEDQISVRISGSNHTYDVNVDRISQGAAGAVAIKKESEVSEGNKTIIIEIEYKGFDRIDGETNKIKVTPLTSINKVITTTEIIGNNIDTHKEIEILEMDGLAENTHTYDFVYSRPYTSIANMQGCFKGADFVSYEHKWSKDDLPESNPEYNPFNYSYISGLWKKTTYNDNRYTYMWVYDGDRKSYINHINDPYIKEQIRLNYPEVDGFVYKMYMPDDAFNGIYDETCEDFVTTNNMKCCDNFIGGTEGINYCGDNNDRFCTSPDLFRYCKQDANITHIFEYCGLQSHSLSQSGRDDVFDTGSTPNEKAYGLKGRLCPYLLKPLSMLSDLSYSFHACSFVGGYAYKNADGTTGTAYMIPESFFTYTKASSLNLNNAFAYWVWPLYTNLAKVFNKFGSRMQLKLIEAFAHPIFTYYALDSDTKDNNYMNLRTRLINVFKHDNIQVSELKKCFCLNESITNTSNFIIDQPVTFEGMFGNYIKSGDNSDYYVFCGYKHMGKIGNDNERFQDKSLNQNADRHNYDAAK